MIVPTDPRAVRILDRLTEQVAQATARAYRELWALGIASPGRPSLRVLEGRKRPPADPA
jgi:hypothetical protein